MKEIMCQIVTHVSEDATTIHQQGCVPVVVEYRVSQLPERGGQDDEKGRRHDESVPVHREVVVNTVEQEVKCQPDWVVWKPPRLMSVSC